MLRKLPGLIWTIALTAYIVKRFVPPETIRSLLEQLQGGVTTPPPAPPAPPASANGADIHTPMPVA
jgi:hypothetical protein